MLFWAASMPSTAAPRCASRGTQAVCKVKGRLNSGSPSRQIGPPDPFRALRLVPPDAVKVVVFGQDPYPTEGHADGLAFSASVGKPASLRRVFAVLAADRPGYWHFGQVHRTVQERKLDCLACHGEKDAVVEFVLLLQTP